LRKGSILEKLTYGGVLGEESILSLPLIELASNRRVLIENHKGVTVYSCHEICIRVCFGFVQVFGAKLQLAQMTKERLIITGCIDSVKLIGKGN